MSNAAWCGLNSKPDILKLHDLCHNRKCKCEKQITFSPEQLQLEGAGIENTKKKVFEGTEKMWNAFFQPGLKISSPIISAGFVTKTKNPQAGEVNPNNVNQ